jgi:hypothetical protein
MEKQERQTYLQAISKRYCGSDKANKQKNLDGFCTVCNYARKYVITLY